MKTPVSFMSGFLIEELLVMLLDDTQINHQTTRESFCLLW